MKNTFAVVGCGRLGQALIHSLSSTGYHLVGIAGSHTSSIEQRAETLGCRRFSVIPWEVTTMADIVFITTPDEVIEDVCEDISAHHGFEKNAVVLHCSGALPSSILSSAKSCGAFVGSMHPLQSFAGDFNGRNLFEEIVVTLEGEGPALRVGKEIVAKVGAKSMVIESSAKTLYHASAVMASNYLVALIDASLSLIQAAGLSMEEGLKVLVPLVEGSLANVKRACPVDALTGPIVRGDTRIVERHLRAISEKKSCVLPLYQALGLHALDMAGRQCAIDATAQKSLRRALKRA